jgi:hypothetical protein
VSTPFKTAAEKAVVDKPLTKAVPGPDLNSIIKRLDYLEQRLTSVEKALFGANYTAP